MIDLYKIKEDFSFLVKEAEPWTLTQFVMWLDLKLSEFKTRGYMVLDHHIKTKPKWLEDESVTADVVPSQAPCKTCNASKSSSRDVGQYFSDIHASRPVQRQTSGVGNIPETVRQKSTDDSEGIRGEVGIIDLSHGEIQNRTKNSNFRPNTNQNSSLSQDVNYRQVTGYQRQKIQKTTHTVPQTEQHTRPEVIEIDGSSPTEKMFSTTSRTEIGRTSTPIARRAGQLLQKAKNRQSLSMGNPIYTSTTTSLTPTFSTSFTTHSNRMATSIQNKSFALGAPAISSFSAPSVSSYGSHPITSSGFSLSTSVEAQIQNLDEIIAQTVQSVTSQSRLSDITPTNQPSYDGRSYISDQQRSSPSQRQTVLPQQSSETVFPGMSISQSTFSQMPEGQAVPVALHANIDNINREMSVSQGSVPSGSDGTDVKMETELNTSITDSFGAEGVSLPTAVTDTSSDTSLSQSFLDTSHTSQGPVEPGGVPRPGLVDPDTARAYQMVELVVGSGVYVYDKTISQAFKVGTERETGTYSGEKMARYLLNVFWSRKDLVGATLSKAGRGKKILNQQIIEAILVFCTSNGRHIRARVRKAVCDYICTATWRARQKIQRRLQNIS